MAGAGGAEVGRVSVRVVPNTDGFRRAAQAGLEQETAGLDVEIPVKADTSGIREKIVAATKGIPDAEIGVDVDTASARAKIVALTRDLPDVKVNLDVDVRRSFLDRFTSSAGSAGGIRFGPFADNIALVAAVAAIAAPAVALLSGALVSLPAILAGVVAPIGAVVLGFDGIKKAAEQLGPPVEELKATMSGVFEDRLTPIFADLIPVFGVLQDSLPNVAHGLSDVAASIVEAVTSAPGMETIRNTINNIAEAISDSAPGIGRFTSGLLGLAEGVSSKFPRVAEVFSDAGDSFLGWVDDITTAGPDGVSQLDRAMQSFGGTLGEILGLVKDIALQGFEWLSDPEFGEAMKEFVADARTLVEVIAPGLKSIFEEVAGWIGQAVDALDKIDKWQPPEWLLLNGNEDQNVGGFPGMEAPDQPWFDGKAGEWLDELEVRIQQFPQIFAQQMSQLPQIGLTAFATLATLVAAPINTIRTNLSGIGLSIVTTFAALPGQIAGAFSSVVGTVSSVIAQIVAQFTQIPGRFSAALASLPGIAAGIWGQVVSATASAMAQVVSAVVSGGAQVLAEVSSWPGKIAGALSGLASTGAEAGRALVQGLINGISDLIGAAVAKAKELAQRVADAAKGALGIKSPSKVFADIGRFTTEGMAVGLQEGTAGVVEQARSLAQQVEQAMQEGISEFDATSITDQIDAALDALDLKSKELKVDYNAVPKEDKAGREALQGQRSEIQALRDQLSLYEEKLGYADKYGESVSSTGEKIGSWGDLLDKALGTASDFVMANANQFMQDVGISGQGALTQGLQGVAKWGEQFIFNVLSVDDAISGQQRIQNKKSLQFTPH